MTEAHHAVPAGQSLVAHSHRTLSRARLLLMVMWTALCAMLFTETVWAEDKEPLEYEVKAAMLFKFLGYIEWPAAAFAGELSAYRVGVVGAPRIARELKGIANQRTANRRPVEVISARDPEDIGEVHLLFIGHEAQEHVDRIRRMIKQSPVAVVTENPDGPEPISMLNLRVIEGRVGFDVSLAASEQRQLKLSSRLLSVAATIRPGDL